MRAIMSMIDAMGEPDANDAKTRLENWERYCNAMAYRFPNRGFDAAAMAYRNALSILAEATK